MKSFVTLAAAVGFAAQASAHYIWPNLLVGTTNTTTWEYVRETNNWQNLNPQTDVTTSDIRCYNSEGAASASTATVAAGSTIGFSVIGNPDNLYHPGVVNVYLAKAPSGTDVSDWDGSGTAWFKIYEISAVTDGGSTITFPATGLTQVTFPIPTQVPSGQYLVRIEHIALHVASSYGGAQFYISCAQIQVTGGGSGTPGPLVAFPGAYTGYEPGILLDIYYPIPTTYTQPGPALWPATGSTSGSTVIGSTTAASHTTSATSTAVTPTSSSTGSTGAAEYAQCGGEGWTGATTCLSPFVCTATNSYYSQCLPA